MEVVLAKEGKMEAVGKVKRWHSSWRMSHFLTCSANHLPHEALSIPPSKTVQISKLQFGNSGHLKKRIKRLNCLRMEEIQPSLLHFLSYVWLSWSISIVKIKIKNCLDLCCPRAQEEDC